MMGTQNRLNTLEAGEFLGISPPTLILWRTEKKGPRYYRLGKRIVYRLSDLEEWMDGNVVEPEENKG